ncbi:peroxiredoxin family protein, partial [Mesoflavibacter profundi]|uniref:peroxiredoxin family protein n=1 Tax=Mesoflavibacter profundi TaxID=2708110 RepID=UPI00351162D5
MNQNNFRIFLLIIIVFFSCKEEKKEITVFGTNIGEYAPTFTAPTPDGNSFSTASLESKVTILDFWASWCGPCRKENPNVVRMYNQYHDKGLEIVGVSLDKAGQKDRWLKAIEQ